MIDEDTLQRYYNEVQNITAVCIRNSSWPRGEYTELKIGETYRVTHISVRRSSTKVILDGFGDKEYNAGCFDLYEDGEELGYNYTQEFRFLAPYLRDMIKQSSPYSYRESLKEDAIRAHLRGLAKEKGIKILFAAQIGSRALGLESSQSDWDVCFIYVHKPEWYTREGERHYSLERVFPGDIDAYGWELGDALDHLKDGNPTLQEWLNSPEIYIINEAFSKKVRAIKEDFFSPRDAIAYYNDVYNKHNERFLNQEGNIKPFLYYLRGVLACKWVESKGTLPPAFFFSLVSSTVDDDAIKAKINALEESKRSGKETKGVVVDAELIEYARKLADHFDNVVKSSSQEKTNDSSEALDSILQEMLQLNA